jgi:hypothetical protein
MDLDHLFVEEKGEIKIGLKRQFLALNNHLEPAELEKGNTDN